jgi:hypothetical protein
MSKKKKKEKLNYPKTPGVLEFIGHKLVTFGNKNTPGVNGHNHDHDHDHDHEHDHSYIAMIIGNEVKEVVNVGGILKEILLEQPKMILINESEYATRPTIGWTYVDEKFISPEESK